MVTKYDVFEIVHENRAPIKPTDVVKKLNKDEREYHAIHKQLRELVKEKVAVKKKEGFQALTNDRANMLYSLIKYCLKKEVIFYGKEWICG